MPKSTKTKGTTLKRALPDKKVGTIVLPTGLVLDVLDDIGMSTKKTANWDDWRKKLQDITGRCVTKANHYDGFPTKSYYFNHISPCLKQIKITFKVPDTNAQHIIATHFENETMCKCIDDSSNADESSSTQVIEVKRNPFVCPEVSTPLNPCETICYCGDCNPRPYVRESTPIETVDLTRD